MLVAVCVNILTQFLINNSIVYLPVPLRPNIIADPSEVYKTMFMRTKRPAAVIPIPREV